ncbi:MULTISPECIES: hypothetical protein [Sorangium]|uniref:hypothetical protein n=1 Tax=Sorangium TaxID=39643 RepID=UPI003D9C0C0C
MKAILFDCDGTLVDSEGLGNEVLVEHVAEYGVSMTVREAMALFRGGKMADCVAALEARAARDDSGRAPGGALGGARSGRRSRRAQPLGASRHRLARRTA